MTDHKSKKSKSTVNFPLGKLPTVPLLAVAGLLNKKDRRSLSQCNRRFRELIWESEDKAMDCRLEYKTLFINVEDSMGNARICFGIDRTPRRKFHPVSLDDLENVLAEVYVNWNYVFDDDLPAVNIRFSTVNIASVDFKRIVEIVGRFKVFKEPSSSKFDGGSEGARYEDEPRIRLHFSERPRNVSDHTIADMVLSNSLIRAAAWVSPDLFQEMIQLCKPRGITADTTEVHKTSYHVLKSVNEKGQLCVTF